MNLEQLLTNSPWIIALIAIWVLPWKGVALWRAVKRGSVPWFIALLILNTLGILDIIYIFTFGRQKDTLVEPK